MAVAENGFMGMGIGAAMTGLRPIVEGMNMGFLLLAYNQISNNAGMLHYTSGGQYKVGRLLDSNCSSALSAAVSCSLSRRCNRCAPPTGSMHGAQRPSCSDTASSYRAS